MRGLTYLLSLFMHAAIRVAYGSTCGIFASSRIGDGPLELKPQTTDRKLGGQALDSTGICLCQRSETRQAFRDVDLGSRVVSRATRPPHPNSHPWEAPKLSLLLGGQGPSGELGGWDLPCPGPVQFYLDSRYPMTAEAPQHLPLELCLDSAEPDFTNSFGITHIS